MKTQEPHGHVLYDASEAIVLAGRAEAAFAGSDLVIDSDTMLAIAAEDLKAVKALQHLVEDRRTAITGPLNQALKQVNELFRSPKNFLLQAEARLKGAVLQYSRHQEAQAAAARAQAEAQMRHEPERLLRAGDQQKAVALEAQDTVAMARAKAREAESRGDFAAAQLADQQACVHEQIARDAREQAEAAVLSAQVLSVPQATTCPPKVDGVSGRTTYTAVVTDFMALVRAVAASQAPPECLHSDDRFLAAQARALKRIGVLFPGVESKAERGLAVTGR